MMLAGDASAQGRVVYLVPNGFPGSDTIHVVEDGHDERFCSLGLRGLDLARTQLGYSPCNTDLPRSEGGLALAERFHDVEALILVDDRSQLSPEAVELLSGAIQQLFGTNYYVVPFNIELSQARSAYLSAGFRSVVVGERLYQDHYSTLPSGDIMWASMLRSGMRTISAPGETLPRAQINADDAAREVYDRAVEHYAAGDFERAFWLFYDVARIPGLGRPTVAVNVAVARAAQGAVAYLEGDYERAADLWTLFSSDATWVSEQVAAEELQRDSAYPTIRNRVDVWTADALIRSGDGGLAAQLFSAETVALGQSVQTRDELLLVIPPLQDRYGPPDPSAAVPIVDGNAGPIGGGDPRAVARQHHDRGQQLYADGRFAEAAEAYEAAYAAEPDAFFLYNIAVAHERNQDFTEAADYFARYLAESPNAPDAADTRRRIENLRTRALDQSGAR
jgi:tetratricopeptide (TPR) repeat protein